MNFKDNLKCYFWVFSNFNTPRVSIPPLPTMESYKNKNNS